MTELDELYQEDREPTPPPHPRILSLANQKGGVGKTTTAINLGTALAAIGERVLIVDLDPQGNASTGLGIDRRNRNCSTYDVLIGEAPLREAVVADVRQFMGGKVYDTMIPRNVRISEAPSYGKPVLVYDLKCVGSEAYLKLATEVIQRERELRTH